MMQGSWKTHTILGEPQMTTPNEFWRCVHRLVEAYFFHRFNA